MYFLLGGTPPYTQGGSPLVQPCVRAIACSEFSASKREFEDTTVPILVLRPRMVAGLAAHVGEARNDAAVGRPQKSAAATTHFSCISTSIHVHALAVLDHVSPRRFDTRRRSPVHVPFARVLVGHAPPGFALARGRGHARVKRRRLREEAQRVPVPDRGPRVRAVARIEFRRPKRKVEDARVRVGVLRPHVRGRLRTDVGEARDHAVVRAVESPATAAHRPTQGTAEEHSARV